jgi:heterodisulfide reductase subunit B
LTLTSVEADYYTIREGAFWGEYDPQAQPAVHIYSCFDPANSLAAYARNRICANESCGDMMTVVGPCNGDRPVCESAHAPDPAVGDYFESCHRAAGPDWQDAANAEIVTTGLRL